MNLLKYKASVRHTENTLGEDYFVGDIQGNYYLLFDGLNKNGFNFAKDRLFCVGDLVDKGPESELCLSLLKEPWFFSVLGNHDLYFIKAVYDLSFRKQYLDTYGSWSASLLAEQDKSEGIASLMKLRMPLSRTIDSKVRVGVGHACFPTDIDVALKATYTDDLVSEITSTRALFENTEHSIDNIDIVFLGHNSVDEIIKSNNILWLDTIHTGLLSIITLDDALNHHQTTNNLSELQYDR